MKLLFFSLCVSLAILLACNNNGDNDFDKKYKKYQEDLIEDTDSLYMDKCLFYGLDNLRDSTQNHQLRVWIATPAGEIDTTQILILKETVYGWEASFNKYVLGTLKNYKTVFVYKSVTIKEPFDTWENFLKELPKTGIYTISDKNLKQSDAYSCTEALRIEIIKDGKYISGNFFNWIAIADKTQIKKIERLIELCRKTFGFDLLKLNLDKVKTTKDCKLDTLSQ